MFESDTSGCLQQTCARWPGKYYKASLVPRLPRYGWGGWERGYIKHVSLVPRPFRDQKREAGTAWERGCMRKMHALHARRARANSYLWL